MKSLFAFFVVLFAVAICGCKQSSTGNNSSASDSTFTLTGSITGFDSGWVYLLRRDTLKETADSVRVNHGAFTYSGHASSPQYYLLGISNGQEKEYRLGFFVEGGKINLNGNLDSMHAAVVSGSPAQDEYILFKREQKKFDLRAAMLSDRYQAAQSMHDAMVADSVVQAFDGLQRDQQLSVKDYVKAHPDSYVSVFEVYENFSDNPDAKLLSSIYGSLAPAMQQTYYGKKIKHTLDIAMNTDYGKPAPDFKLNDPSGNPVSLSSFRGKIVLVDFWASWCSPCRQENPNVVKAYNRFHAKGFTILGVSLDDSKPDWQQAIEKDGLSWTHVSDLKGWQSSAAALYGVQGIPMNFLLDKEGRIVGKGLRGENLVKKLNDLMP